MKIAFLVILFAVAHANAQIAVLQATPEKMIGSCESVSGDKWWLVKNCKLAPGATLDDLVNEHGRSMDALGRCGEWGPWITDQNGNVMYRQKNPACPKQPAPKGTGNYSEDNLRDIGKDCIPESMRPRTLSNYVTPQWKKRCKVR